MSYLSLEGIYRHYDDDFDINVDFCIEKGEFFTLLGPSGCGKTTLLRIMAGFIKPDSGRIVLSGKDITSLAPASRNISIVFQNYALFPDRSVYRNISYGPEARKWDKRRISEKVENMLNVTGLERQRNKRPGILSGGEKQRVALARAVAAEPEILLLDEPLSALDVTLRNSLRNEIREIHDRTGITTVYVTHDQEEALSLSDRISLMNSGKTEQIDTPSGLYHNPGSFFAANFIGESNCLPVKTSGKSLVTAGGLSFNIPSKVLPSGSSQSFIFFRPEYCTVTGSGTYNGSDRLTPDTILLKVKKKVFLGGYARIETETPGGLRVILHDHYPYGISEDTILKVRIDPGGTIYFRGEMD